MSYVTTNAETRIFYKDWGPKNAQPIVFHHGWPLTADDWDTQMLFFLGKGYRAIALDRRGHGRSSQVSDGHDMDHYAADAAAVVEHLNLRNAVHVSHSTGTGEADALRRSAWFAARPRRQTGDHRRDTADLDQDTGQSRRLADGAVRRATQATRRQPLAVLHRFREWTLLWLQPSRSQAVAVDHPELVAPSHDGRRQSPL